MKHKLLGLRIIIGLCSTLCWFGFLYPELTTNSATVRIVSENRELPAEDYPEGSELQKTLTKAGNQKIRYRSKIYTNICALWEAFYGAD